jgi:hypothetical protein
VLKFKVDKSSKGAGHVSIEKADYNGNPVASLVFRSKFGAVLFQGQLMKNLSKFIKHISPKAYKIQRIINVVAKKDEKTSGVVKCMITFAVDQDCKKFQGTFYEVVNALPEIIKPQAGSQPKPESTAPVSQKSEPKKEEANVTKK